MWVNFTTVLLVMSKYIAWSTLLCATVSLFFLELKIAGVFLTVAIFTAAIHWTVYVFDVSKNDDDEDWIMALVVIFLGIATFIMMLIMADIILLCYGLITGTWWVVITTGLPWIFFCLAYLGFNWLKPVNVYIVCSVVQMFYGHSQAKLIFITGIFLIIIGLVDATNYFIITLGIAAIIAPIVVSLATCLLKKHPNR